MKLEKYIHRESAILAAVIVLVTFFIDWKFSTASLQYEFSLTFYIKLIFCGVLGHSVSGMATGAFFQSPKDNSAVFDIVVIYNSLWFLYGDFTLVGGTKVAALTCLCLGVVTFNAVARIYMQFEQQIQKNVAYFVIFQASKTLIYFVGLMAIYSLFLGKSEFPVDSAFAVF